MSDQKVIDYVRADDIDNLIARIMLVLGRLVDGTYHTMEEMDVRGMLYEQVLKACVKRGWVEMSHGHIHSNRINFYRITEYGRNVRYAVMGDRE